jgi:hypothetical protein
VPLPPAETEALYRRTLREQGWQPLCGFVTQRLASGLPQDADVQTYARGQQQLIYSVRSLDRPGESDVRLCWVGRSVPVESEALGAAEWRQDRPTWTATEHGVNCRDLPPVGDSSSNALLASGWRDYPAPTFPLPLLPMPAGVKCSQASASFQEGQLFQQAQLTALRGFGDLHQHLATQLAAAGCRQVAMEQADRISVSRWHVSDRPGIQWQVDVILLFASPATSCITGRIILRCDWLPDGRRPA